MIKLKVEDYCQNCLNFEPYVIERPQYLNCTNLIKDVDVYFKQPYGDTIIECEHKDTCKNLYFAIMKEVVNNDSEKNR